MFLLKKNINYYEPNVSSDPGSDLVITSVETCREDEQIRNRGVEVVLENLDTTQLRISPKVPPASVHRRLTQKKNEKRGVLSIPKENIEAAPKIDTATVAIVTVETEGDRVREAATTIDPATVEDGRGLLMTEEKDTEGTEKA